MKELIEYRTRLIDKLDAAARDFRDACLAVRDPYAPIEAGGWNMHQLAVHTRDSDRQVYGLRARRTLQEDNPLFSSFDGDAYMAAHYDAREPLRGLLDELVTSVGSLAGTLRKLPPEGWSRESRHETQGVGLTLQTWVERSLEHLEEHLETARKAK
jgi:hypothetical protein